ncbi:MAG: hypothetical protein JNM90_17805 [Burkholderiales bacterium]|nr:hypothetical protein [Burkholderiales bacterium]
MKRPSFSAVAVESARRDPDARSLELNLVDAKGNSQNITLSTAAISHVLGAVFQKRMADPTKDFFLDEAIPLAGIGTFELPTGHTGLRLYLSQQEVFDVAFAPETQTELREAFRYLVERADARAKG